MSFPELDYRTDPIRETGADAILLALPPLETDDSPGLADWPGLREALTAVGFTGAPSSFLRVHAPDSTSLPLAVGFGVKEKADVDFLRGKADIAVVGSETLRVLERGGVAAVEPFLAGLR